MQMQLKCVATAVNIAANVIDVVVVATSVLGERSYLHALCTHQRANNNISINNKITSKHNP